jgi:hypothetical protein
LSFGQSVGHTLDLDLFWFLYHREVLLFIGIFLLFRLLLNDLFFLKAFSFFIVIFIFVLPILILVVLLFVCSLFNLF